MPALTMTRAPQPVPTSQRKRPMKSKLLKKKINFRALFLSSHKTTRPRDYMICLCILSLPFTGAFGASIITKKTKITAAKTNRRPAAPTLFTGVT